MPNVKSRKNSKKAAKKFLEAQGVDFKAVIGIIFLSAVQVAGDETVAEMPPPSRGGCGNSIGRFALYRGVHFLKRPAFV
jgi:hypothetical protein